MKCDIREALAITHVTHPNVVTVARVTTAHHSEAILGESDDGEIRADTTCVIEEVCVNTLSNGGISTDLCHREVFHKAFRVCAFNIKNGEVRKIDHANTFAHSELLGVGNFPEVTAIPLSFSHRYLVAILCEQGFFVSCVAVRSLPTGNFHKVTTECDFALVEGAHPHAT